MPECGDKVKPHLKVESRNLEIRNSDLRSTGKPVGRGAAPDLHVSRFDWGESELFLIQETYFGPKLTGNSADISEVSREAMKINPNEELFAGNQP